jgi:hypothetical protein
MSTLADIAAGRLSGSADQRRHIYSCDFCLNMVKRIQQNRTFALRIPPRIVYPASLAACLVIGLLLGHLARAGTVTGSGELLTSAQTTANIVADTLNDLDEPVLRKRQETLEEVDITVLRKENHLLCNKLEATARALRDVLAILEHALEKVETSENERAEPSRAP